MDTQRQEGRPEDYGDESLNTGSAGNSESENNSSQQGEHQKGGIHNNALYAAGMGRAATAQVDPHNNSALANTGTNISYDGPTAPGAGGSEGTGYTSGQAATGQSIATDLDYEQAGVGAVGKHFDKAEGDDNITDAANEMNEQR